MANLFYYSQKHVLYLISFIQDGQQRNLRNPHQKELTVFSWFESCISWWCHHEFIHPRIIHEPTSKWIIHGSVRLSRRQQKWCERILISNYFWILFPCFSHAFPFECRSKNGPTKSPAASPCSAAHCAGRPGATPWLSPRDLVKGGKWLGVFWFGWDRHLQFDSLNCSDILWYIYMYIIYIYIGHY